MKKWTKDHFIITLPLTDLSEEKNIWRKKLIQNSYNYCPYCGRKFPIFKSSETRFCCFCGKKLKIIEKSQKAPVKCTICHKDLDHDGNQIIMCSFCESEYHYSCIFSWLVKFNSCPMCQNVFLNPNLIQRSKF